MEGVSRATSVHLHWLTVRVKADIAQATNCRVVTLSF